MNPILYVWWFLLALAILIAVHEYGHYLAARLCGVKVLRFALGFGPVVVSRRLGRDQTEWALCAIPLGGYVRMLDEREAEVSPQDRSRAFNVQSLAKRSFIVAAGPIANFLLAIFLYWGVFLPGSTELAPIISVVSSGSVAERAGFQALDRVSSVEGQPVATAAALRWALIDHAVDRATVVLNVVSATGDSAQRELDLSAVEIDDSKPDVLAQLGVRLGMPNPPAVLGALLPGGPAEAAGLHSGDIVVSVASAPVKDWVDFYEAVGKRAGLITEIGILRDGQLQTISLTPEHYVDKRGKRGRVGVAVKDDPSLISAYSVRVNDGVVGSLLRAIRQTVDTSVFSLKVMWRMVRGDVSLRNISGPVTIADYAGQTASMGLEAYLRFLALVSISLGVLNLLPVPILDGGHLLYYVAEFIRGRPLSEYVMELGQRVGIALLVSLSVFALFNDINRLISG